MSDQHAQTSVVALNRPSPSLAALLVSPDDSALLAAMDRSPALTAQVEQSLPALREAALASAGNDGVRRVIGRRLALFPPMTLPDGAFAAWWQDYFDALGDLTEAQLEAGMRAHIRDPRAEFMPKPGKLRELAQGAPTAAAQQYARARSALREAKRQAQRPREAVDPAVVADMMVGFRESMGAFRAARAGDANPSRPVSPISAQVGETGVSDELRRRVHGSPEPVEVAS